MLFLIVTIFFLRIAFLLFQYSKILAAISLQMGSLEMVPGAVFEAPFSVT